MRIFTFLTVFLLSLNVSLGQTMLSQDFTGTAWPPAGWTIDQQTTNWSRVATANAGGSAPELRLNWSPLFNGTTRFVSPSVDLSSNEMGIAIISFRQMVDHYTQNFVLGVAVRKDNGAWTTAWSQTVTANIAAQVRNVEIPAEFINSSNFQFAFFFTGNSNNINFWYIDDVKVMIPLQEDLALSALNVPRYFAQPVEVKGTVNNNGINPVNSFSLNWQIGDGPVNTTNLSGLNIPMGGSFNFTSAHLIDADPGVYDLNVFVSNVNGTPNDDDPDNDSRSMTLSVAHQEVSRLPLFEEFTSSTCPPCATFNNSFFNNFAYQNADNMVLIKYQMSWPAPGDPYYTAEGGARRVYYGVTGVPSLFIDGKMVTPNAAAVTAAYQQALQKPAFLDINGFITLDGNTVNLTGELIPYADFWDVTLHAIIIEGLTTGNVGSNGETSFHHVMMKMLPNASGTQPALTANNTHAVSFTQDMSSTFVEEMDDLMAVVFLQDNVTKEIFQSAYMLIPPANALVNTSIENNATGVNPDQEIVITFNQPLTLPGGGEITNETIQGAIQFTLAADKQAVSFHAAINDIKTRIVISPAQNLAFESTYNLHVGPLAGYWQQVVEVDLSFTVRESMGQPLVEFNPEDQAEGIQPDQIIIASFNQAIKMEDGEVIDNSNVHELISFKLDNNQGADVDFTATISNNKTIVYIQADNPMAFLQTYYVALAPVMGVDAEVNQEVSISFTTRASVGSPTVILNVENQQVNVPVDQVLIASFSQPIRMQDGQEINNTNVNQLISFNKDNQAGEGVDFTATINENKTEITIEADDLLDHLQLYYLALAPVMGIEQDITAEVTITFTTQSAVSVNMLASFNTRVYPNPARTTLNANIPVFEGNATIKLIDLKGNVVLEKTTTSRLFSLDVTTIGQGKYFLEVTTTAGRSVTPVQIIK